MHDSTDKPNIHYCSNCVYPSSSAVALEFDERGFCSGCQVYEEKDAINWDQRKELLITICEKYKTDGYYDCIIPVSGGKDSYFQTHIVINELGLNPLLVTYNGNNFSQTALTYSISDSTNKGGKLGWVKETSINLKIKNQLEEIKIGNYTKPMVIPGGFLILKVEDTREIDNDYNLDEEIEKVINEKTNEQLNQFSNIYFNKVRKNITINEL